MKTLVCVLRLVWTLFVLNGVMSAAEPYREPFADSFPIRREQHLQIKAYVDKVLATKVDQSLDALRPDFSSVAAYARSVEPWRERVIASLGGRPPGAKEGRVTKFQQVGEDAECTVFRVWIEVVDGVEAYGIYLVPKGLTGKAPLIVAQHGGGGSPEAMCDLDTRVNYRSFGREAVRKGYIVWAPALAMRCDYCGDEPIAGAARELLDQKLRLAGTSINGLELQKIVESTRTLMKVRPEIDADRVGMTGLSYGGFFTLYATAIAPFIKVAAPSASFRDSAQALRRATTDDARVSDRNLFDSVGHFQAIALICPRPCLVQVGEKDTLINMPGARIEAERAARFYRELGIEDRFRLDVHSGGHEFDTASTLAFFAKHL